jgi:hypothetical protein
MKDRNWKKKDLTKLISRPLKHAKAPTAPNIFIKEEDLPRLSAWQASNSISIYVVHVFDQQAFAIKLDDVLSFNNELDSQIDEQNKRNLQLTRGIFKEVQAYNRVDATGASEKKVVFKVSPEASITAGDVSNVDVQAQLGVSTSKKYVAHVIFKNGELDLAKGNLLGCIEDLI